VRGPAPPGRHAARSGGDPEDPRAPGPLPIGVEPRARPARVLIRSTRAAADPVVSAPRDVIGADPPATWSQCRLTAAVCQRSIPLSLGGVAGARRLVICAVPTAPAGIQRAEVEVDGRGGAHAAGSAGGGR
jgi:hypothetical protein